ncbi:hypothetical protein [Pseudogemmobacter sonorensis]|uniref:hypothetical protein n=1 Tax=Pseudogemmobacter sonorensis TaxID=2989681 RepID=UPI0036A60D2E
MSSPKIILIHETARESWSRDFGSAAVIVGLWSLGWFADSASLEWVGVILALLIIASKAQAKISGESESMSPDEAREWLDRNHPPQPVSSPPSPQERPRKKGRAA